jgi:hypothetical protein
MRSLAYASVLSPEGLDAGGGDDEVRREAEQDAGHEEPGHEHRMAIPAVDRE